MDQTAIFTPMFALFGITFAVWVYMYAKRIPFITGNDLTPEQLHPLEFARLQPPEVSNPSDNLKNLFEMPVLFYALVLYLYVTNSADSTQVALAWGYVGLRAVHSAVHCTFNHVMTRFVIYAISSVVLAVMMVLAAL